MPTNKSRAEYMRDRRAQAKAAEIAAERASSKTADARALLSPKRKEVPCGCEPPSDEFPKGIKCWGHLIPLMSQQQRDEILTKVVKG